MCAKQPGASGVLLVGQGSAAPPVHGGSRSEAQRRLYFVLCGAPDQGSRVRGQAAQHQPPRGGPARRPF
ncbi:hypothetical protein NDU88_005366 [Pleurodeles waltl]|uniref:Uncharacterized protein n=1 Tax=Pleurodeles waltl TaxID=8319 RepID=A0AAV7PFR5_PLEWA|nr:hypothetical protein NDU88_005366 [Pleurodeles waltl]